MVVLLHDISGTLHNIHHEHIYSTTYCNQQFVVSCCAWFPHKLEPCLHNIWVRCSVQFLSQFLQIRQYTSSQNVFAAQHIRLAQHIRSNLENVSHCQQRPGNTPRKFKTTTRPKRAQLFVYSVQTQHSFVCDTLMFWTRQTYFRFRASSYSTRRQEHEKGENFLKYSVGELKSEIKICHLRQILVRRRSGFDFTAGHKGHPL